MFSLLSLIRSKLFSSNSSLPLGLNKMVFSMGRPVSNGIIASASYVIEKEVSLVDLRGVI